jgi:Tol biopolymer transport system component
VSEVRVVNADGSGDALVAGAPSGVFDAFYPSWSPDGERIAFADSRAGGIFTVRTNGSELTFLSATTEVEEDWPVWAPDGSKIAYIAAPDGARQIFTINPDGSERKRLTTTDYFEDNPSWSPDSRRIAFRSSRDRAFTDIKEVYVMNADGSGQRRLTTARWFPHDVYWSSDGTRLAFIAEDENPASNGYEDQWLPAALYVMYADGAALRRVAGAYRYGNAVWKP